MPNILTIQIDLDRLNKYGVAKNPTGHVGDLLAETLDRFARTQYGTGTNSNGEYSVWTHNTAHVGTARVTQTGDADHAATTAPAATPSEQTWTFFGHWDGDRIVVEYETPGEVQDDRDDDGEWPEGLWAAAASGTTLDEAQANAVAEYEDDLADRGNDFYPNGQCTACGWGLDDSNGCPNPDCERHGDKLPADED